MTKNLPGDAPSPAPPAPEKDELGPAIRDVTYQLVHDFSDTRDNVEDAIGFAPLAAAKLAQRYAGIVSGPRKRTVLAIAGLATIVLAGAAWLRRRRSS